MTKNLKDAAILIVDDQEANIDLLENFLADDNYTNYHSTTDPRTALSLYDTLRPDLVLLDLHMPHLDGFAVMQQLCARVPTGEYLPILVLTADITSETKQRALSEGAKDFLSKPLDETEVLLRIKNLLETRFLHRLLQAQNEILQEKVHELHEQRELSERLLLNILPRSIAERLKHEERIIADSFPEATVLFADIVGFTAISSSLSPEETVHWLNDIFSAFDQLAERHRLEKIKTIGDAYMIAGGLPTPRSDHAEAIADLALAMREEIGRHIAPNGEALRMRIGVHSGQVVAGVIGTHKFIYDLWGDTVNTASRMALHGVDGAIQVTSATYERLRPGYLFEERGSVEVKGKGAMQTYLLAGKKV